MKTSRKGLRFCMMKGVLIGLLILCATPSFSSTAGPGVQDENVSRETRPRPEVPKILSVLESQAPDGEVSTKAREKLNGMSGRQVRLIASLSDLVSQDRHGTAADVAYLLMAVLIILS
jgi:hypothetical protein